MRTDKATRFDNSTEWGGGGGGGGYKNPSLERVNLSVNNIKDMCERPHLPYNL